MVSRLIFSWARVGLIAAALGCVTTVANAQSNHDGGARTDRCTQLDCYNGNGFDRFRGNRGGWDGVRPGWRNGERYRPRDFRRDRPIRNNYRPYRPRHYDYDSDANIYLDFSTPRYRSYEPVYPRRTYRRVQLSEAHVQWCYDRYRTYRESDNTFVPRRGVRAQCYSPYS